MAKSEAVAIYERLLLNEANLSIIVSEFKSDKPKVFVNTSSQNNLFDQWFKGVVLLSQNGETEQIFKAIENLPEIFENNYVINRKNKTVLLTTPNDRIARIFMVKALDDENPAGGLIVAELNAAFLWGIGHFNTLPQQTMLFIKDQFNNVLVSPFDNSEMFLMEMTRSELKKNHKGHFEFMSDGIRYFSSYQSIFMRSRFSSPDWIIVLSQNKSDVFEPLIYFKTVFPLVILLSVWIVLLLSIFYIRKSLVPLEKLKEATKRVAHRDFGTNVEVISEDEFADLAKSFNSMASQLKKQFDTLATRARIDRAILSSLDTDLIVKTVLEEVYDLLNCGVAAIGLLESNNDEMRYYIKYSEKDGIKPGEKAVLSSDYIEKLINGDPLLITRDDGMPSFMNHFESSQSKLYDVVPAVISDRLIAIVIVGYTDKEQGHRDDDLHLLSQLASQMAVALENSRLIEDLEKLSWGAMEGFGRAVDAKSSWTAGHSERVTKYAVQIARAMDLPEKQVVLLHRASYLHDIGKIGIPIKILDKEYTLSEEEYEQMKSHPSTGAEILKPIKAFEEITPIIKQHHENFDGSGYPEGLKGEEILIEARILRVADVFDALASLRPYREEWNKEKIVTYLKNNSGKEFDKELVDIFLKLLNEGSISVNPLLMF